LTLEQTASHDSKLLISSVLLHLKRVGTANSCDIQALLQKAFLAAAGTWPLTAERV
jgi:hypothetical protein